MFNRIPTDDNITMMDDPPTDMKGSGSPFVGKRLSTTLMLIRAWKEIMDTIPRPKKVPNGLSDRREMRTPLQNSRENISNIVRQPKNPKSSPTAA